MDYSEKELHKVACSNKPDLPIKDTSTWIAILYHSIKDPSKASKRQDFLWLKCHVRITIRTLKSYYFQRQFTDNVELHHGQTVPNELSQVKDLRANHHFGKQIIVLRAIEVDAAEESDEVPYEEPYAKYALQAQIEDKFEKGRRKDKEDRLKLDDTDDSESDHGSDEYTDDEDEIDYDNIDAFGKASPTAKAESKRKLRKRTNQAVVYSISEDEDEDKVEEEDQDQPKPNGKRGNKRKVFETFEINGETMVIDTPRNSALACNHGNSSGLESIEQNDLELIDTDTPIQSGQPTDSVNILQIMNTSNSHLETDPRAVAKAALEYRDNDLEMVDSDPPVASAMKINSRPFNNNLTPPYPSSPLYSFDTAAERAAHAFPTNELDELTTTDFASADPTTQEDFTNFISSLPDEYLSTVAGAEQETAAEATKRQDDEAAANAQLQMETTQREALNDKVNSEVAERQLSAEEIRELIVDGVTAEGLLLSEDDGWERSGDDETAGVLEDAGDEMQYDEEDEDGEYGDDEAVDDDSKDSDYYDD